MNRLKSMRCSWFILPLRGLAVLLLVGAIIGLTFATLWPTTYTDWYKQDIQTALPVRRVMKYAMWTLLSLGVLVVLIKAAVWWVWRGNGETR